MVSWRSGRGPLTVTVAKRWGKIPTVHGTKMSLPGCLSAPGPLLYAQCTMATSFYFLVRQLWPLCIFCPSTVSIFCSFWTVVPCNCHLCCGDVSKYSVAVQDCFPSLGSVWIGPKGSLWARGALPSGVGVGFLSPSSFTLQLTSSSSCSLSIFCASHG